MFQHPQVFRQQEKKSRYNCQQGQFQYRRFPQLSEKEQKSENDFLITIERAGTLESFSCDTKLA